MEWGLWATKQPVTWLNKHNFLLFCCFGSVFPSFVNNSIHQAKVLYVARATSKFVTFLFSLTKTPLRDFFSFPSLPLSHSLSVYLIILAATCSAQTHREERERQQGRQTERQTLVASAKDDLLTDILDLLPHRLLLLASQIWPSVTVCVCVSVCVYLCVIVSACMFVRELSKNFSNLYWKMLLTRKSFSQRLHRSSSSSSNKRHNNNSGQNQAKQVEFNNWTHCANK